MRACVCMCACVCATFRSEKIQRCDNPLLQLCVGILRQQQSVVQERHQQLQLVEKESSTVSKNKGHFQLLVQCAAEGVAKSGGREFVGRAQTQTQNHTLQRVCFRDVSGVFSRDRHTQTYDARARRHSHTCISHAYRARVSSRNGIKNQPAKCLAFMIQLTAYTLGGFADQLCNGQVITAFARKQVRFSIGVDARLSGK